MANGSVKGNIMPLELALRREREYQAKVERSTMQQRHGSREAPISTQKPREKFSQGSNPEPPPERCLFPCNPSRVVTGKQVFQQTLTGTMGRSPLVIGQALQTQTTNSLTHGARSNLELNVGRKRDVPFKKPSQSQGMTPEPEVYQRKLAPERLQKETTIREVTEDRVRKVKFATPREFSSQGKRESSRFQPHIKSKEVPVCLQASPASPAKVTSVGMKRKASEGSPTQMTKELQLDHSELDIIKPDDLFCKQCHIICSSSYNLEQHYNGKGHKAKLQELKYGSNGLHDGTSLLWCNVCRIRCMDEFGFRQHLAGKKHASCVQAIKFAKAITGS